MISQETQEQREAFPPGSVIAGRYEIREVIGRGGMATVYLASDRQCNGMPVALKALHKQFAEDKIYVERFIREVQLMSKVDDRNVVKTFDIGTDQGVIYFTMEYVKAPSLEKVMDNYSFSESQMARLIVEICRGLQAIHAQGIIHRDLKPANVLVLSDASVKITDFGVAREKYSRLTTKTQKVGSVCYMAPEIWLGKKLTPAIDFYSLGVVLYELCTGDVPFEHDWIGEMMRMHIEDKPVPPIEKNSKVPPWLNQLVLRLMEKSPKDRFKTAEEIMVYVRLYALEHAETAAEDGQQLLIDRDPCVFEGADETTVSRARAEPFGSGQRRKTYVFQLTGTRLIDEAGLRRESKPRRKTTVVIPLPRKAAVIIEIESPSRDFLFLGVFLASLQIFDAVFTSIGLSRFGLHAEGNPLLRRLMIEYGPDQALIMVKLFAIMVVVGLTVLAKKLSWVKDLIGVLSCVYLFAAIIPWLYLLYIKYGSM